MIIQDSGKQAHEDKSSGGGGPRRSRRSWDPSRSTLLETTILRLLDLYKEGSLQLELRPTTLIALNGDFRALYFDAFKVKNRPAWCQKRYPEGFSDFVNELNARLASSRIHLVNTRAANEGTVRLSQSQREVVQDIAGLHEVGAVTLDIALMNIKRELGVELSDGQIRYYFHSGTSRSLVNHEGQTYQKTRVAVLHQRLEEIKQLLGVDLAIRNCLNGLLFESFVGVVLTSAHGASDIIPQKPYELRYTDFGGQKHNMLFTDYECRGTPYEVKMRNSTENILCSALSQFVAVNRGNSGELIKTNVIYLSPNPEIRHMHDRNLLLRAELERMGFPEKDFQRVRFQDAVVYESAECLISRSPYAGQLRELFGSIREIIQIGNHQEIRRTTEMLNRLALLTDDFDKKLAIACTLAEEPEKLEGSLITRLFGPQARPASGGELEERRRRLVAHLKEDTSETILLELYQRLFTHRPESLSDFELSRLEAVDSATFEEAAINLLIERESHRFTSPEAKDTVCISRNLHRQVLDSYTRLRRREDVDILLSLEDAERISVGGIATLELTRVVRHLSAITDQKFSAALQMVAGSNIFNVARRCGYASPDADQHLWPAHLAMQVQLATRAAETVKASVRSFYDRVMSDSNADVVTPEMLDQFDLGLKHYRRSLTNLPGHTTLKRLNDSGRKLQKKGLLQDEQMDSIEKVLSFVNLDRIQTSLLLLRHALEGLQALPTVEFRYYRFRLCKSVLESFHHNLFRPVAFKESLLATLPDLFRKFDFILRGFDMDGTLLQALQLDSKREGARERLYATVLDNAEAIWKGGEVKEIVDYIRSNELTFDDFSSPLATRSLLVKEALAEKISKFELTPQSPKFQAWLWQCEFDLKRCGATISKRLLVAACIQFHSSDDYDPTFITRVRSDMEIRKVLHEWMQDSEITSTLYCALALHRIIGQARILAQFDPELGLDFLKENLTIAKATDLDEEAALSAIAEISLRANETFEKLVEI